MQALEEWNDKFGGMDHTKSTRKSGGFDFEFDTTYKVRVKSAKITRSSKGDRQVQFSLAILNGEDNEVGKTVQWLTLPKQPETDVQHPPEQVYKWTLRRRDDFGKVLANWAPGQFGLYADKRRENDRDVYLDAEGQPMSKADLDARQLKVNSEIMSWADTLHGSISEGAELDLSDLDGTEFYMVKVDNKRNPKYPYTNLYANPSPKLPMFQGEEAPPF